MVEDRDPLLLGAAEKNWVELHKVRVELTALNMMLVLGRLSSD